MPETDGNSDIERGVPGWIQQGDMVVKQTLKSYNYIPLGNRHIGQSKYHIY